VVLAEWGLSHNGHVADSAEPSPYRICNIATGFPFTRLSWFGEASFLLLRFFCANHDAHLLEGSLSFRRFSEFFDSLAHIEDFVAVYFLDKNS
jgi:hypothetical protein